MGNRHPQKPKFIDPKILPEESIMLLERQTKFERSEIKKIYELFIKDASNGKITSDQFISSLSKNSQIKDKNSEKYLKKLFQAFDKDESGQIDFSEYMIALSMLKKGTAEEKLKFFFAQFDANKDKEISEDEMTDMIKALYDLNQDNHDIQSLNPYEKAKEMIEKLDSDKNGCVDIDEFVNGCMNDEELKRFLFPFM